MPDDKPNQFTDGLKAVDYALKNNIIYVWYVGPIAARVYVADNNCPGGVSDNYELFWNAAAHATFEVMNMCRRGEICWEEMPTPHPTAMRSFSGDCRGYRLIVVQARMAESNKVEYHGMLMPVGQFPLSMAKMPPTEAKELYETARNACPPPKVNL